MASISDRLPKDIKKTVLRLFSLRERPANAYNAYCDCIAVVALAKVRVGSPLASSFLTGPPWVGQFCRQRTRQRWDTPASRLHFRLCLKVWKRTTTEWSSTLGWTHWFSWMLMVYLVYQWISLVPIAKAGTWGLDMQGRDASPLPRPTFFSSGYGSVVNLAAVSGLITQSLSCCHHDRKAKTRLAKKCVAECGHQDDLPQSLVLKKLTGEKMSWYRRKKPWDFRILKSDRFLGTHRSDHLGLGPQGPNSATAVLFFSWSWCSYERRPHSLRGPILPILGMPNGAIFLHGGIRCKGLCPIRQRFFFRSQTQIHSFDLGPGCQLCSLSSFPSHCRAQHPFPGACMGFVGMRGSLGYFLSYESPGRDSWGQLEISLCPQVFWSLMVSKTSGHTQISEFSESQAGKTTKSSGNPRNDRLFRDIPIYSSGYLLERCPSRTAQKIPAGAKYRATGP